VQSSSGRSRRRPAQGRQALADAADRRRGRPAAHGVHAAERLVEHEREGVEVDRPRDGPALGLLRGHVGQGPDDVARARQRVVADELGDAEVRQLRAAAVVGDHDVRGLDVAVDNPALVGVGERVAEHEADLHDVAVGEQAVGHQPGQRAAAHELGDEVDRVLVLSGLVERDDPRVAQPGRRARLALGTAADVGVLDADALDRHRALELLVVGQPHGAHAPRPQPA
jgi:hypothetical protein